MSIIETLQGRGVVFPDPGAVYVAPEVDPMRILPGAVLHPSSRITGKRTLIMEGAEIGSEGPAVVHDCAVGPGARLKGGSFSGSVFLSGASVGPAAHVRPGTIFEEGTSAAHAAGVKQTILFPWATLGSLVNFCDCLMSGGTGPKNHSEVGSSYIHFNFTPQQDKATASLIGDVPRGVMLRENPIFLGGQGGLAGPCNIAYGSVIAAGTVWRRDIIEEDRLWVTGPLSRSAGLKFTPGLYKSIAGIVEHNLGYLGNLVALFNWYVHVRSLFFATEPEKALHAALVETCREAVTERLKQMALLASRMPRSIALYRAAEGNPPEHLLSQKQELFDKWPIVEEGTRARLDETADQPPEAFLEAVAGAKEASSGDYLKAVLLLDDKDRTAGTAWLDGIVAEVMAMGREVLSSFA
ncbi:MAG: protein GlmU [Deltaproteobacteria bacterium]|nr:protein GlmU [Deltaproteobacteria bacterium]